MLIRPNPGALHKEGRPAFSVTLVTIHGHPAYRGISNESPLPINGHGFLKAQHKRKATAQPHVTEFSHLYKSLG